jgi:uncharacterized protein (TIGR03083 family)
MAVNLPDPDDAALAALHALDAPTDDVDAVTASEAVPYADTVAALAEAVATPPLPGLRGRVLSAAFAGRTPGESIDDGGADAATVAFSRTVADLDAVLGDLDEVDWDESAHPAIGRVRDVVAHLFAIELYVLGQLPDPPVPDWSRPASPAALASADAHVETTRAVVDAVSGWPVGELRARWRSAADALTLAAQHAPAATTVDLHGLPAGIEGAMFMRTFELWAHLDDICRATGRRRPRLDARRLRAMSAALVEALPIAMALSGHGDAEGRARLVMTGPGGGTHDVELGGGAGPEATVTVDVVDLCRVAAQRAEPSRIEVRVDGDRTLADAVLASASAFAMD